MRLFRDRASGARHSVHRWAVGLLTAGMPLLPVLVLAVVVLLDVVGGAGMPWLPLLAAGPALAASTNGPRGVACVGLLAVATGVALAIGHAAPVRDASPSPGARRCCG
ncbi:hypothetical protein [Streptomyces puniciscabiei]|uniref:hypothetical protein n=1 Tax=Streptomyces puniciscabiei TaxID=164348 RepID=UPI003328B45A